ncbi:MAG: hypothetical protein NC253_05340 [Ruminococcus sp.]|nr:hypothetical protein [Ruminococcus sp.]
MELIKSNAKEIALTGEEVHVKFASAYPYFWVRNDGNGAVLMSLSPGISEGGDGVVKVLAGSSAGTMHGNFAHDSLYLSGAGTVQVMATMSAHNPFKCAGKGGEGNYDYGVNFSTHNMLADYEVNSSVCSRAVDGEKVVYTIKSNLGIAWYLVASMITVKRDKMYKMTVNSWDGYGRLMISPETINPQYSGGAIPRTVGNFLHDERLFDCENQTTKYFYNIPRRDGQIDPYNVSIWFCSDDFRDGGNGTNEFSFEIGLYEEI